MVTTSTPRHIKKGRNRSDGAAGLVVPYCHSARSVTPSAVRAAHPEKNRQGGQNRGWSQTWRLSSMPTPNFNTVVHHCDTGLSRSSFALRHSFFQFGLAHLIQLLSSFVRCEKKKAERLRWPVQGSQRPHWAQASILRGQTKSGDTVTLFQESHSQVKTNEPSEENSIRTWTTCGVYVSLKSNFTTNVPFRRAAASTGSAFTRYWDIKHYEWPVREGKKTFKEEEAIKIDNQNFQPIFSSKNHP